MKQILISFFLLLNLLYSLSASAKPLHFALFLAEDAQDPFWRPVADFAQQAAKQLDVKLSVMYTDRSKRNMFKLLNKAKALNVDAVIFTNIEGIALQIVKDAEQLQLPILLFNSNFSEDNQQRVAQPQQKFKYWLASLIPDDHQAGYLLGKYLIEQARKKNLTDENNTVQIIAINGTPSHPPAQRRLVGLKKAIQEDGNSNLLRTVNAYWDQEKAHYKSKRLSIRYPQATVYWTASDHMAIGVYNALTENGLTQGKDYLTGGIDWSREGLTAIINNQISNSTGGHFMDGAWAVVMLYDHFNGHSFKAGSSSLFESPMSLLSTEDIDLLLFHLESHEWQGINFHLRSKTFNKQLKEYHFSPASVLAELHEIQNK